MLRNKERKIRYYNIQRLETGTKTTMIILDVTNDLQYLVLETWSSEGRKGLFTVAEEVFPKAVRPNSLIWERPSVLASRGRCNRKHTADATSAFTSWNLMYVRPLVMTGVDRGSMFTPSALISTDTEDGHARKKKRRIIL